MKTILFTVLFVSGFAYASEYNVVAGRDFEAGGTGYVIIGGVRHPFRTARSLKAGDVVKGYAEGSRSSTQLPGSSGTSWIAINPGGATIEATDFGYGDDKRRPTMAKRLGIKVGKTKNTAGRVRKFRKKRNCDKLSWPNNVYCKKRR